MTTSSGILVRSFIFSCLTGYVVYNFNIYIIGHFNIYILNLIQFNLNARKIDKNTSSLSCNRSA